MSEEIEAVRIYGANKYQKVQSRTVDIGKRMGVELEREVVFKNSHTALVEV